MKRGKIHHLLVLFIAVQGSVACQQAAHSFSSDSEAELASTNSAARDPIAEPTNAQPLPVPGLLRGVSGACSDFMSLPVQLDLKATEDQNIQGAAEPVILTKGLRNLTLISGAGGAEVRSAINANLTAGAGEVRINAQTITNANAAAGRLCIRADHIGAVDAGTSNGTQALIANEIDSLSLGNAPIHIYFAKVKTLVGKSAGAIGAAGQICLHNGATIENFDGYNPNVADSTCL